MGTEMDFWEWDGTKLYIYPLKFFYSNLNFAYPVVNNIRLKEKWANLGYF